MLTYLEIGFLVAYLALGFRYCFALTYAEELRERLKLTKKEYNVKEQIYEEVKLHNDLEGDWINVARAAGWSLLWMWIWPLHLLTRTGKDQLEGHAHKVATAVTGTKKNPHIRKLDLELKEIRIKQLEQEVGIGQNKENS